MFDKNPSTGENKFYGEFLINAQGEDVVAGIRTPESIENLERKCLEFMMNLFVINLFWNIISKM